MIPNYQGFMLPLLQLINDDKIHTLKECVERLSDKLNLTEDEKYELLPSGKQTIVANRISWAKFYLEKAGLLEVVSHGKYRITQEGINLLSEHPTTINNEVLSHYEQFLEFMKQNNKKGNNTVHKTSTDATPSYSEQTPEELLDTTYRQLQSNLSEQLLKKYSSNRLNSLRNW